MTEYHASERTKPNGDGDGACFLPSPRNTEVVWAPWIDVTGRGTRVEMRDEKSNRIDQTEVDWKQPTRRLARVVDKLPVMVKMSHKVHAPSTVRLTPLALCVRCFPR
jgi:hypothetical protein